MTSRFCMDADLDNIYNDNDSNDGDNDDNVSDIVDDYSCNSVNFEDRTSRFCMELDLYHTFDMLTMIFNY